ncbi:hypothetical protein [Paracoccus sp. TOH]|uniref:hypothetical protein n=1 Tax=Paracoccus sp. TOH TaxID=1263728 RepID=UPI0025B23A3A|nr:hypothetical protein [Paracoccus sp. TOH]WJS87035.1 hypothetical protein NBE95_18460 [Paracoccus sp. TOH]
MLVGTKPAQNGFGARELACNQLRTRAFSTGAIANLPRFPPDLIVEYGRDHRDRCIGSDDFAALLQGQKAVADRLPPEKNGPGSVIEFGQHISRTVLPVAATGKVEIPSLVAGIGGLQQIMNLGMGEALRDPRLVGTFKNDGFGLHLSRAISNTAHR